MNDMKSSFTIGGKCTTITNHTMAHENKRM